MGETILVVDDSLTVRMDIGEAFRRAGFEVVLCANGAEARAAIARNRPALIVLDVMLPDLDGVDLLAELRGGDETAEIPVILLSSESEVKDRLRGMRTGASAYVGKPYDSTYVVAHGRGLLPSAGQKAEAPCRIHEVDDSLTFRQALAEELRASGYEVVLAASGEEGLRRLAEVRPDAIVVDGVMPGLDGTTVVRRIRLDPALQATPCLLLTASDEGQSEVEVLDAGADAYVRKGEGTDFVLARLHAMLRAAEESRERIHGPSLLGPQRILAVDDSMTYLAALAEELRKEGFEVVQARSGEEALELLTVESFDCILLDLLMPGLSGTETCRRIKASPSLRNVPLIMLTELADPRAMIDGINAGADDYVAKAAELDVLKARVRAQLRRKQFEAENRRIREEILRTEAEALAAHRLAEARSALLERLERANGELEVLNRELRTFAYSVSHDLRQPLRAMDGFSKVLLEEYAPRLDETGRHYLERIRVGAQRMEQLIEGLLTLSRVNTTDIRRSRIALESIARRVIERLSAAEPSRRVECVIAGGLAASADPQLVESVLENLLGNAWKFTSRREDARIELRVESEGDEAVFCVQDNGVGFKMEYAHKLFGPFQRLHSDREFSGTGIGLATVQRIIHRHGGRLWAESSPGDGARFYFTLGEGEPS